MGRIIYFSKSIPEIKYHSRSATQGAEYEMVKSFIAKVEKQYIRSKTRNLAIFIEPQIESGYPDIVLVEFGNLAFATQFQENRLQLSLTDLKILFEILQNNTISIKKLEEMLGYSQSQIIKTIDLLDSCNLVKVFSSKKFVRKRDIKSYFAITKIISIEAKIDKWFEVIEQSYVNQWFTSEAYVLLNRITNLECVDLCKEVGMGVLTLKNKSFKKITNSIKRELPVSYLSLLFNEWIMRFLSLEMHSE